MFFFLPTSTDQTGERQISSINDIAKAPMTWIFAAVTGSNHVLINRNNLQCFSANKMIEGFFRGGIYQKKIHFSIRIKKNESCMQSDSSMMAATPLQTIKNNKLCFRKSHYTPWRLTAGTCPHGGGWFRSFSFLFMGDGCRFQPLIFQGVRDAWDDRSRCCWCFHWPDDLHEVKTPRNATKTIGALTTKTTWRDSG